MRLVAKHAEVGYLKPSQRPGCRNCQHVHYYIPERGIEVPGWSICNKHRIECSAGGICSTYTPKRGTSIEAARKQVDMLQRLSVEMGHA